MLLDQRYPEIGILNLEEESDCRRLLLVLSGVAQTGAPDLDIAADVFDSLNDEALLELVTKSSLLHPSDRLYDCITADHPSGLSSRTAIVESAYVDRDANIAHARLVSRAFWDYPRRTIRIHFFARSFQFRHLFNADLLQKHYLGYVILSPAGPTGYIVDPGTIARAILKPPESSGQLEISVPTVEEHSVNLAGVRLTVKGTSFAEQDGTTASCAGAAVWMSVSQVANRFGPNPRPASLSEITQLATRYSLPADGRRSTPGLDENQMMWSIHELGFEPIRLQPTDANEAKEAVFSYINSGIPPILILALPNVTLIDEYIPFHTVTAVGFTNDPRLDPVIGTGLGGQEDNTQLRCSQSSWAESFLFHDDQYGVYLRLRFIDKRGAKNHISDIGVEVVIDNEYSEKSQLAMQKWYANAELLSVLAPLPSRNLLQHDQAANKGIAVLEEAFATHHDVCGLLPEIPVYRTYLAPSNDFKRRFAEPNDNDVSSELAKWYLGSNLPRYIWVTEMSNLALSPTKDSRPHRIIADVALDPASSARRLDFVTLHLPHCFLRTRRSDTIYSAMSRLEARFSNDPPYYSFDRYLKQEIHKRPFRFRNRSR